MVALVDLADAAQLIDRRLVVQVADQGVAGIGGHGQHAAAVQQCRRLLEQARLRVVRVYDEKLGHARVYYDFRSCWRLPDKRQSLKT